MPRIGLASILAISAFALLDGRAVAATRECTVATSYDVAISKQIGDVYNQVASDGDELWPSYFAKGSLRVGEYAYTIQTHRSQFDTQHQGSQTNTVVHTIAGPTVSVPWFVAVDQTSEARVERCIHVLRFYAGVAYLQVNSNYGYPIGYGPLHGFGAGLERYADPNKRFDVFAALYFYPAAAGPYGSGSVSFEDTTFDGGFRWRPTASKFALTVGLYQEIRAIPGLRVAQTVRAAPYFGISVAH